MNEVVAKIISPNVSVRITGDEKKVVLKEGLVINQITNNIVETASVGTFVAGETLGGQRAVWLHDEKVWLFDPADANTQGRFIGITRTSVNSGEEVVVVLSGIFSHASLALNPDEIYFAGTAGVLTSTPPAGIVQAVGVAINSSSILINNNLAVETA